MLDQMSQREKVIVFALGGVIALLVNVVLIKFFMKHHGAQKLAIATSQREIEKLKALEPQRKTWEEREKWLNDSQPVLGDNDVANRQLGETIKDIAKKHTLIINQPNPGVPNKQPHYTALGMKIDVKGQWPALRAFLTELQAPGQFIVLDPVEIKVDPTDKTQHHVTVTVSKWFAP